MLKQGQLANLQGHSAHRPPLRILMVALSLDVGGLERLLIDLVRALRQRGHHVEVCTLKGAGELAPALTEEGVTITCLNKPEGLALQPVLQLRDLIRQRQIDVVHTHNSAAHLFGSLAGLLAGHRVGLIHTRHGLGDTGHWRANLRNTLCAWLSDFVVPVSGDTERVCRDQEHCPSSRLRTIINGIDLTPYQEAPPPDAAARTSGNWHIGHVGRLSPVKNQAMLLKVHARFLEHYPDAHLSIVGDGPCKEQLQALAGELGLNKQVTFPGYRSDIAELMKSFDWFCLTSLSEGLPLVAIEAMASARPVIATAVGGLPEIVRDGETGFLAESEDIDGMLARWLQLARSGNELRAMGLSARKLASEHYGLGRMTDEYETLYYQTARKRGNTA